MSMLSRYAAVAALCLGSGALEAGQQDSAVFDVTLRGFHTGTLTVSGAVEGRSYAASGVLKSGGLIALVRKVRYDARAAGTVAKGRFTPTRYEEDADTGKRRSEAVMEYRGGVPQVKVYTPPKAPRPGDVDPATQGGTVDPLTAAFAALRDTPREAACNLALVMFDGRRRTEVVIADPVPAPDGGLTCTGEYRRLEGFTAKDMAEKSRFPFRLTYAPLPDGRLRVMEITTDTLYGKGRLTRR